MSRNGSGTMTVPNTLTAGTPITASDHNENYSDIAAELTNSVAADGQTSMTGALKASSGTASAPGVAFASDPDSGLYRIGSNNVGVAVNGTKIVDVATTGASVTGTVDATAYTQGGVALLPVGLGPLPWSGTTAPSLWVLAGATYSRATYAALWTFAQAQIALGNTFYTNGDGSTTFTIATMDGYVAAGTDAAAARIASFTAVGSTAGAAAVSLAANQIPTITAVNASQSISVLSGAGVLPTSTSGWSSANFTSGAGNTAPTTSGSVGSLAANSSLTGTNSISTTYTNASLQTTPIVQPSRAFKQIIFAGV